MNLHFTYAFIFAVLLALELLYFRIADRFNIIDKPNERSSHSAIVLRGGGIIFLLGVWLWEAFFGLQYPLFLVAVTLAAGISFIDDIRSLPDGLRLVVQFVSMALLLWQVSLADESDAMRDCSLVVEGLIFIAALIVFVGAADIYNFMDGINGITSGYSLAVMVPLIIVNRYNPFVEESLLAVICIAILIFSFFNFRPKGKAKCFAGDVGSVGIAFILLFAIGMLIVKTGDVSWMILLLVYGVDGMLTIFHRILLHEHLGEAHRKHAYQLMANELKMDHVTVSVLYMCSQLIISISFIYIGPMLAQCLNVSLVAAHWIYLVSSLFILSITYILFMKKYYHLHEEYLSKLGK